MTETSIRDNHLTQKIYEVARVAEADVQVVSPSHFSAAPVPGMGVGLFANVDLMPGDIWWANALTDQRFVERVIPWQEHQKRDPQEREEDEIKCYVEASLRALVICTEPFCRVNHGSADRSANADTDKLGNSIITVPVPAGQEILIPYEYESVISLIWKFPEFANQLPETMRNDENFLFLNVLESRLAMEFLKRL